MKNTYIHKAVQSKSPDLLPMEFENRYTVSIAAFKAGNKPPNIAPVGIHGALQANLTNTSAKLLASYDFRG